MRRWVIMVVALLVTASCSPSELGQDGAASEGTQPAAPTARGPQAAAATERTVDVVYVDVRTPREFAAGHVQGAINIPHDRMAQRWPELEEYRDGRLVLYCRSGRRSGIAYDVLERQGFDNVENAGGLEDLQAEGVAVTR